MGRPPSISREAIVNAAASKNGRWTMAGLARDLGVSEAALYHYFPSKSAVLVAVGERFLGQVTIPDCTGDWQTWLTEVGTVMYDVIREIPTFYDSDAATQSLTERNAQFGENLLMVLVDAGFTAAHAMDAILLVLTVVQRHARLEAATREPLPPAWLDNAPILRLATEQLAHRTAREAMQAALRMAVAGVAATLVSPT